MWRRRLSRILDLAVTGRIMPHTPPHAPDDAQDGRACGDLSHRQLRGQSYIERDVLQAIMENTDAHLAYLDPDFNFVAVNTTYAEGSGHVKAELLGRNHFELFPNAENQAIFERARGTRESVEFQAKPFEFAGQPWRGVTYWDWRLTPDTDENAVCEGSLSRWWT